MEIVPFGRETEEEYSDGNRAERSCSGGNQDGGDISGRVQHGDGRGMLGMAMAWKENEVVALDS